MKFNLLTVAALTLAVAGLSAHAADKKAAPAVDVSKLPPASTKTGVTFATDIKPIFEKSCVKCHGAEKPKGKLRLDSLEGVLKGGEDGKVIEPGKSASSSLVIAVAQITADDEMYMPPPKNKAKIGPLTAEQVGLIRAWVDQGAK